MRLAKTAGDGPAFPIPAGRHGIEPNTVGMTIRDYFAASALQGLAVNFENSSNDPSNLARWAYQMADAMVTARER